MTLRQRILVTLLCAAALSALVVGCGSSSDEATTGAATTNPSAESGSETTTPSAESDSEATKPSAEFTGKGNNKPGSFGQVASEDEREAASKVLEKSLTARAAHDWEAQCATLSAAKASQAEVYAPGEGCAAGLAAEIKRFSVDPSTLANTMNGPIAVLRVDGDRGYALYHGKKNQDYAIFMLKEGGEWKLGRLKESEVP